MKSRNVLICAVLPFLAAAQAPAAPDTIEGWWRAPLRLGHDDSEFFLKFERRDGKLVALFSAPAITADQNLLGPVTIDDETIRLVEHDWRLRRSGDGSTIVTTMPGMLIPTRTIEARFQRSAPPRQPSVPPSENAAPAPVWTADMNQAVVGGLEADASGRTIFAGGRSGALLALDARSGRVIWRTELGLPIRAAPRFSRGNLFVATDETLHNIDARSGRSIWSKPIGKSLQPIVEVTDGKSRWDHYSASPVVLGNDVLQASRDGCLYRFERSTGRETLRYCTKDSITATPVVHEGTAYLASFDQHVHALKLADGSLAWKRNLGQALPRDLTLGNGTVVAGSRSYDLAALDLKTGASRWQRYMWFSWVDSSAAREGPFLAIGSSDAQRVFAMNSETGAPHWSTFIGGWAWARPAIGREGVYAGVVGTTVAAFGRREGGLAALDRRTGRLKWLFRPVVMPGAVLWGFASDPLLIGNRVLAADLSGRIYAFPAT